MKILNKQSVPREYPLIFGEVLDMNNREIAHGQPRFILRVFGILVNAILVIALYGPTVLAQQAKQTIHPPHADFRYVIIKNLPLHNGRMVFVLLDPKSFSEKNLRELFLLVSKRFPQPDQLWIAVFTSLEQLPTPEEEDYLGSAQNEEPENDLPYFNNVEKYPGANYTRFKGSQVFKYSIGDGQLRKTVIISGKNISPK